MKEALIQYQENINHHSLLLQQLKGKRRRLGWLRLLTILITFSLALYLFQVSLPLAISVIAIGIAVFLFAVSVDAKNNSRIEHHGRMLYINEQEVMIQQHQFSHKPDGSDYIPHEHPYAADLDLFGNFSIFQYINRCTAEQSTDLLAVGLLSPAEPTLVLARQAAAQELAPQLQWRQELQALGIANPITNHTEQKINHWLKQPVPYQQTSWSLFANVYACITLGSFIAYLFDYIPSALFSGLVAIYFIIGLNISRFIIPTYTALSKIVGEIETLKQQLAHFEELPAKAQLLQQLQQNIADETSASSAIEALKRILNRFDYRLNILVFFVLNSFLLWDLRQQLSLNKWQHQHAKSIHYWFKVIAEIEVLQTIAALTFNHSNWVFPVIKEEHFTLNGLELGHPLIKPESRVNNTFSTYGVAKVSVVTGSNMAGKSTFLRSLGVNLVLAQLGAPVCAKAFEFSPVKLYSSMRIADNLAENTSTFYAELKKLKTIIEQVNAHEKVFILLDEILRGTNSLDRHEGSKSLIKQLVKENAVAVIATHDVELAELEQAYPHSISNYHFDVQVEGEELYFDYKLKQGVCKSMNASILMKKIGIQLEA